MATVDLLASTVMNNSAALMNDAGKQVYTFAAQLPYLQLAMNWLQEQFQLNSIPVSETTSAIINIEAGETSITFNNVSGPALPDDLIEPKKLWESAEDQDIFIPMAKKDFIPQDLIGTPVAQFMIWVWQDQRIKLLEASVDIDVKIEYVKTLFARLSDENSPIDIVNAETVLSFKTAALMAKYIERNVQSALDLEGETIDALDRTMGIGIKGKQAIQSRRRPFRAAWKNRMVISR